MVHQWENNRAFVAGANGVLAELDADKSVFTEIGKVDRVLFIPLTCMHAVPNMHTVSASA